PSDPAPVARPRTRTLPHPRAQRRRGAEPRLEGHGPRPHRRDRGHPARRHQSGPLDGPLPHRRAARERYDVQLQRRGLCGELTCPFVVTVEEIRAVASKLPRTNEGLVRGQVKFRVGRIVYLSISRDSSTMGFAFPKDWRNALVESEPEKFSLPSGHDMRYHWVDVRLDRID